MDRELLEDLNVTFTCPKASETQVYKSHLSKLNPLTSFCSTCKADFRISRSCISCLLSSSWACLIFRKQNRERSRAEVQGGAGGHRAWPQKCNKCFPPHHQPGQRWPRGLHRPRGTTRLSAYKHGIIQKQRLNQSIRCIKTVSTLIYVGGKPLTV